VTVPEWRDFLGELSRVLLDKDQRETDDANRPTFPLAAHESGYIGFEGATEEQIVAAEQRLNAKLPLSYRTFLKVSNGWPVMWHSVEPGKLWSTEEIRWTREQDPELIEIWGAPEFEISPEEHLATQGDENDSGYRSQYVQNLLSISDHGDACDLLLSPEVVDKNGEWECWKIASWYPGAQRWRSFEEWFRDALEFQRRRGE
jgi:hypothetical protein